MIKKIVSLLTITLYTMSPLCAQGRFYLSDIILKPQDSAKMNGYSRFGVNYWRHDEDIFNPKKTVRYNTATAFHFRIVVKGDGIVNEILRQNYTAPYGKMPKDSLRYVFNKASGDSGFLVRKLLIKEKYVRIDTFLLRRVDSFEYRNARLISRVFGNENAAGQKSLKIYAYRSVDSLGGIMMHYWVERIGIIKLADERCWRYSFEIQDYDVLKEDNEKLFSQIYRIIKNKYKDPYWPGDPCYFE